MATERNWLVAFVVVLVTSLGGQAMADLVGTEAAVWFPTSGRTGVGAGTQTRGFTFTLDNARTLTHLGMYNYNGTGESAFDRQIGVWGASGALVADLTIPAGPGGELDGDFIWRQLASPVLLQASELYTAGVWYSGDNSPGLAYGLDVATISGFHYGQTAETGPPGGAFAKPTIIRTDRLNGYFGPNLRLQIGGGADVDIPEPATMLAVFGAMVGLGGYVRRRHKA